MTCATKVISPWFGTQNWEKTPRILLLQLEGTPAWKIVSVKISGRSCLHCAVRCQALKRLVMDLKLVYSEQICRLSTEQAGVAKRLASSSTCGVTSHLQFFQTALVATPSEWFTEQCCQEMAVLAVPLSTLLLVRPHVRFGIVNCLSARPHVSYTIAAARLDAFSLQKPELRQSMLHKCTCQ